MTLEEKVLEVVTRFCQSNKPFTSLDVSNTVKVEGFGATRHRDIASLVRESYNNGELDSLGFTRSLIDVFVGGMNRKAYLYHGLNYDIYDYADVGQKPIPPKQSVSNAPKTNVSVKINNVASVPSVTNTPNPVSSNTIVTFRQVRGDGRLEVPPKFLKELSLDSGDSVKVIRINNNSLKIITCLITDGLLNDEKCLKINSQGRLFIPSDILSKYTIVNVKIELCNGEILISNSNTTFVRSALSFTF